MTDATPVSTQTTNDDEEDAVIVGMPPPSADIEIGSLPEVPECAEEEEEEAPITDAKPAVAEPVAEAAEAAPEMKETIVYKVTLYGRRRGDSKFGYSHAMLNEPLAARQIRTQAARLPVFSDVYDMVDTLHKWFGPDYFFTTHDMAFNFAATRNYYLNVFEREEEPEIKAEVEKADDPKKPLNEIERATMRAKAEEKKLQRLMDEGTKEIVRMAMDVPAEIKKAAAAFSDEASLAFAVLRADIDAVFEDNSDATAKEMAKHVKLNIVKTLRFLQANEMLYQKLQWLESFVEDVLAGREPSVSRADRLTVMRNRLADYAASSRSLNYELTTFLNTPHKLQSGLRRTETLVAYEKDCARFEQEKIVFLREELRAKLKARNTPDQIISAKLKVLNMQHRKRLDSLYASGTVSADSARAEKITTVQDTDVYQRVFDEARARARARAKAKSEEKA